TQTRAAPPATLLYPEPLAFKTLMTTPCHHGHYPLCIKPKTKCHVGGFEPLRAASLMDCQRTLEGEPDEYISGSISSISTTSIRGFTLHRVPSKLPNRTLMRS